MTIQGKQCQTPFGVFELTRYPPRRHDRLRAWNSADLLLLEAAATLDLPAGRTLVVNDEHGVLTVALQPLGLWTDSRLSALAVEANLEQNRRPPVIITWSTARPPSEASCAVMRIPKQLAYFEYQLSALASTLPQGATLLAAGMDKHLSPHTATALERCFGPTERHPGRRRARVFQARNAGGGANHRTVKASYACETLGATLSALPNVFSRDRLDVGSRLLLGNIDLLEPAETLLDLACGNGVLGLAAYHAGLARRVTFCDESAMAVQSAKDNALRLYPGSESDFSFFHGDGLLGFQGERPRLILCNPPFHSEHTVDDFVGRRLVAQGARRLPGDGRFCLVANRHLDYGHSLRRHFNRVERLSGSSKFNLWLAHKG